jgi:UrcA family protein
MSRMIACLVAAAALAAPALAETPTPTENFAFRFSFDQAQLAGAQGAERVHRQLRLEATRACRVGAPSAIRLVDEQCRDQLVDAAVKRINNPQLTQVHFGATAVAAN